MGAFRPDGMTIDGSPCDGARSRHGFFLINSSNSHTLLTGPLLPLQSDDELMEFAKTRSRMNGKRGSTVFEEIRSCISLFCRREPVHDR